jgi:hypothetical protein
MGTSAPGDPDGTFSDTYTYSGNGAMTHMSSLPVIEWDYADRMRHANQGSGGGDVFVTYDGGGQRVRKVFPPTTSTTLPNASISLAGRPSAAAPGGHHLGDHGGAADALRA